MSATLDLVVLASGRGSNLAAIFAAIDARTCDARVVAVVSDRADAAALGLARDRGVEARVVPLAKGQDRDAWDATLTETVASFSPGLVVLAGFMRIVGPALLAKFSSRIVNVHPALLPAFRGKDAVRDAIAAGARVTGCTVHLVDSGVDTGPILAQAAVPVLAHDDVTSLHDRIRVAEHRLLPAVIHWIARGALQLSPTPRYVAQAVSDGEPLYSPPLPR